MANKMRDSRQRWRTKKTRARENREEEVLEREEQRGKRGCRRGGRRESKAGQKTPLQKAQKEKPCWPAFYPSNIKKPKLDSIDLKLPPYLTESLIKPYLDQRHYVNLLKTS